MATIVTTKRCRNCGVNFLRPTKVDQIGGWCLACRKEHWRRWETDPEYQIEITREAAELMDRLIVPSDQKGVIYD